MNYPQPISAEKEYSALAQDLRAASRALQVRSACSKAIIRSATEEELTAQVCRVISEAGGYKMVWIGYADSLADKVVRIVAEIGIDAEYMDSLRLGWGDDEKGQGLTGSAIRSGKPSAARHIMTDPAIAAWRKEDARRRGYGSGLVLPLISEELVFGVLALNSPAPDAFDTAETELLAALADDLAFGITALREKEARRDAEKALLQGRELLLTLINNIPDTIFYKDIEGRYIFANTAKIKQAGKTSPEEIIGKTVYDLYPAEQARIFDAEDRKTLAKAGCIAIWEEKLTPAVGGIEWRLNTKVPVCGPGGESTGLITIGRDITKQKNAEELLKKSVDEKETLLMELQHRVKNNLSLVSSLLSLGMNELADEKSRGILLSAQTRVRSIMAMYEHLNQAEGLSDVALHLYLKNLAETLFMTYALDPGRVELDTRMEPSVVDTRRSIPLGLILNELLTNSLKYAFPGGSSGKIRVSLTGEAGIATLCVSDTGVGLPAGFSRDTSTRLGLKLVGLLSEQIGGDLSIASEPEKGTSVRISFRL